MTAHTVADIRRRALAALVPPPRLPLSDWIEANIRLPEGVSALPGPVRLWPYQRGIADAISDPQIERVTIVKPVRVGFTTLLTGAVASFVANEPAPVLALLPTEADARDYVVSEIEPTFGASPALRAALAPDAEDGDRNTLLHRRFPGGSLKVVAAKAPRNLRRHTARVLLIDEADAMEIGPEGSPIRLAERRTLSYPNRKIVIGSTPLFEDTSAVLRSYAESDMRVFEVPCPECGAFHEIMWGDIVWEDGKPETAAYRCRHCGETIPERHKAAMVEAGRWRATRVAERPASHAGFRLNALVSLLANASWGRLAAEFLAAKDSPEELQVFTNTILAQGWQAGGSGEIDEATLAARAEPFDLNTIPAEVLAITVGADVQDDRCEAALCGWTRTSECLVLGHFIVWGAFTDQSTWDEFGELLTTRWRHPFGGTLKVDAAVVDCGDGDHYDAVMNFTLPRLRHRIFSGKGMAGSRPGFALAKGKRLAGRLAIIGVDVLKSTIFDRLTRGRGIRFSASLEPSFYEQLASERRVIRYKRGRPVRRFERISTRARAEALDALVYGFAARQAVSIIYDAREAELRQGPAPPPSSVVRSRWMER